MKKIYFQFAIVLSMLSLCIGGAGTVFASGFLGGASGFGRFAALPGAPAPQLVINEVDYDQGGTDLEEFVEIKNTGDTAVNLSGTSLQLINGSLGVVYGRVDLPDKRIEAGGYYVVCFGANTASYCDTTVSGSIQNGAPDAIGLFFDGAPVDLLSYEGSVQGYVEVSGNGLVDDENFPLTGIARIPDGNDTNDNNADFGMVCVTPGRRNIDRSTDCGSPPPVRVQFISNSLSQTPDIYIDDLMLIDNFFFRTATPFIEVPGEVETLIGVAMSNSNSVEDTLVSIPLTFEYGKTYVVAAQGILGDPTTPFTLHVNSMAREAAEDPAQADFAILHGSPGAPDIDVDIPGAVSGFVTDLAFGEFSNYFAADPEMVPINIRATGDPTVVGAFEIDFSGLAGQALTIFSSGILQGDPPFGLFAALPDGTVFALPVVTTGINMLSDQLDYYRVAPNPVRSVVQVEYVLREPLDLKLHLYDTNGRLLRVQELGQQPQEAYNYQLDMGHLPQGIYIISLVSKHGVASKPIIVTR